MFVLNAFTSLEYLQDASLSDHFMSFCTLFWPRDSGSPVCRFLIEKVLNTTPFNEFYTDRSSHRNKSSESCVLFEFYLKRFVAFADTSNMDLKF